MNLMKIKQKYFWIGALLIMISCGSNNEESASSKVNKNNIEKEVITTDEKAKIQDQPLTEWEIRENEYPLLYGKPIIEQEELSSPLYELSEKINLVKGDFDEIDNVFQEIKKLKLNDEQQDSAFFMYKEFLETIYPNEDYNCYEKEGKRLLEKKYNPYGFKIYCDEGETILVVDLFKISELFDNIISDDLKKYAGIDKLNNKQLFFDAALIIPWDEYADYVLKLEDYVIANTQNKYYKYILLEYSNNLEILLWGIDNTPTVVGWDDKPKLDDNVSKVYEKLINDKKHKTGLIIKKHNDILVEKNYLIDWEDIWTPSNQEIEKYLEIKN